MLTPAMTALHYRVRSGAYHDSIVLMQLQSRLAELPGIADAGAVMGTEVNRELLTEAGLLPPDLGTTAADDLVVVVRTEEGAEPGAADAALDRVPELLARRDASASAGGAGDPLGVDAYRPKSLRAALERHPDARWVLVSVPGRWAAGVADEALAAGRHVFLFSDNVPLDDEVTLKRRAAEAGLLVSGPDCGTARVAGVGLGFANRGARGAVGAVAASGTGLQMFATRLDALGGGLSHALGTGGRDLTEAVAGATARAALDLLARDDATRVITLISKPPAPTVAARTLAALRATGKPAVVCFLGRAVPFHRLGDVVFASSPALAAEAAVRLLEDAAGGRGAPPDGLERTAGSSGDADSPGRRLPGRVVGLFSGGTLAQEALEGWTLLFGPVTSNLRAPGSVPWTPGNDTPAEAGGHLLLDLGEDHFTRGRPHPMLDPTLVAQRFTAVAGDDTVAAVLLDVVLGDGAHPDPAALLAPAIEAARNSREAAPLAVVVILVGSASDPQDRALQKASLEAAGAAVVPDVAAAQEHLLSLGLASTPERTSDTPPVDLGALEEPLTAINVGVETFHHSLVDQGLADGVGVVSVDWRPPAGGDERLAGLLARMQNPKLTKG